MKRVRGCVHPCPVSRKYGRGGVRFVRVHSRCSSAYVRWRGFLTKDRETASDRDRDQTARETAGGTETNGTKSARGKGENRTNAKRACS